MKIKLRLAELGMNQTVLARECGIPRQNVSAMLKRGTCSIINAGRLAKALDVDIREIIKED